MGEQAAQRKAAEGEAIIDQLGGVPVTYALACELPGAHGEPLSSLERIWYDRFEEEGHDWVVILNGYDHVRQITSVDTALEGGAALIVCDNTVLCKLTPIGLLPFGDPETGETMVAGEDGEAVVNWRWELLWALHARLTEKGKDLPPLHEIMSKNA
ncbi:hypothetical protein [Natronosalvus rutilus]|uniref:Uncharacterized protein n=1 Tax=Natronosalvus rutilus TaxID=2953753 RepID=A0A9E7NFD2_9EURY|nr:hypothetical protein [Natronosalvus rutilus]UTF56003.1 hypothetical protein NGM29_20665 [Natronosalvus rutilus]